jgi:hypothetical protein
VLKAPPRLQSLDLMALTAQCAPLLQRSERVLRVGRIMAPVTPLAWSAVSLPMARARASP